MAVDLTVIEAGGIVLERRPRPMTDAMPAAAN
jgi:hypothetical protein